MSDTEANSAPSQCERLLDYLYGELDEAGKRAFEEHLPTCARCQAETQSFGRARTAAKRVMAPVEPPANLTGALHAQLLHAASQRRPKRGVVLQLFRRVAQHPQMAAAAMFVIVGGAFVFSWQRAKLFPPTEPAPIVESAKPTEANEGALDKMAANQPAAAPLPEGAKGFAKEEAPADEKTATLAKNKEPEPVEGKASGGVVLQTPQAAYAVDRTAAAHRRGVVSSAAPAPKAMRSVAKDGFGVADDLEGLAGNGAAGGALGGAAAGTASTGRAAGPGNAIAGGMISRADVAKKMAPAKPAPSPTPSIAASAPAGHAGAADKAELSNAPMPAAPPAETMAQSTAPAAMPSTANVQERYRGEEATKAKAKPQLERAVTSELQQAAPPAAAPAPVASTRDAESDYREKAAVAQKPSAPPPPPAVDAQRKKFDELARTNRCDEAIKLFHELERTSQAISPTERAQYARCLMANGRQQEAEQQLLELKTTKKTPAAEVQKLQDEVEGVRAKQHRSAAKKSKAAPVDAPAFDSSPPRQAQQAPAQASPPPAAASPQQGGAGKADRKATTY